MRRLGREEVVTIEVLHERGCAKREIGRQLGIDEKAVRYRLARRAVGAVDGRAEQPFLAEAVSEVIAAWIDAAAGRGVNLALLHEHLVAEHHYGGSYKSVQRYVRAKFPRPKLRTRRRVETPPGAQGQADWAEFRAVPIGASEVDLYAFELVLSHSRMDALVWSEHKDQLAWHDVHNRGLRRIGGVPAVLRVDNEKTAMARGAGPWGELNEAYRSYARAVRFHVDASRPRAPGDKGKVERRIRDQRLRMDPHSRRWASLEELQAWTDERVRESALRRQCPATGQSVWEAWQDELAWLAPLPLLPEPFDVAVQRRVGIDATLRFEGRSYSVPFRYAEREVEVHGCARAVQIWADGGVVAEHPRHTRSRILIEPAHYDGPSDERVEAPVPLGKMGRRLQELAALPPQRRPIDLYAALAEVAR